MVIFRENIDSEHWTSKRPESRQRYDKILSQFHANNIKVGKARHI